MALALLQTTKQNAGFRSEAPGAGVFFAKIPLTFPWVEGVWWFSKEKFNAFLSFSLEKAKSLAVR